MWASGVPLDERPHMPLMKSESSLPPDSYGALLREIKERIRSAQYAALRAVNRELINLYWDIGRLIVERQSGETYAAVWLVAYCVAGKVNSADKLYLVIESVRPDTRHPRSSTVPVPADGAGGFTLGGIYITLLDQIDWSVAPEPGSPRCRPLRRKPPFSLFQGHHFLTSGPLKVLKYRTGFGLGSGSLLRSLGDSPESAVRAD
jgi:hypothetical protein